MLREHTPPSWIRSRRNRIPQILREIKTHRCLQGKLGHPDMQSDLGTLPCFLLFHVQAFSLSVLPPSRFRLYEAQNRPFLSIDLERFWASIVPLFDCVLTVLNTLAGF